MSKKPHFAGTSRFFYKIHEQGTALIITGNNVSKTGKRGIVLPLGNYCLRQSLMPLDPSPLKRIFAQAFWTKKKKIFGRQAAVD